MAIAAAAEALVSAGIEAARLTLEERRRIAVLVGSGGGPVEFFEKMYGHWYRGELKKASAYAIPTGTIGTLSSELSMRFGLKGPSHVVSTGCTSSADAIGYASKAIRYGERDVVLVGGADAVITAGIMTGFGLMQILASSRQDAPETASRPFDAGRDGFVLGEGAWFFVLEEMERARARGVPLFGEVVGYAATCDAYHRVRLDESGEEPARAMTEALEDARLSPADVGYVQYHGTGTELNDRIETRATKIALGGAARTVPGSSIKSQVGHPQGASGAAGLAATLLALNAGFLPPTINLDDPDPECDLDYVPRQTRRANVEIALVNGIAFGSKNTALVVRTGRALEG
jgi:3-oxoacyl-[acyl-carrier-protein] synthase II